MAKALLKVPCAHGCYASAFLCLFPGAAFIESQRRPRSSGAKVGVIVHKGSLGNPGMVESLRDALSERNLKWLPEGPSVSFHKAKLKRRTHGRAV